MIRFRCPVNPFRQVICCSVVIAFLLVLLSGSVTVCGQTVASPPETVVSASVSPVTAELIETRRKEAEATKDLDEGTKEKIAELYTQASEELKRAEELAAQTKRLNADAQDVQARQADLKRQIEALQAARPALPAFNTLPELEQELTKRELRSNELKAAQAKAEAEPTLRANRRKEIRDLLVSAPDRQQELKTQLDSPPPADELPLLTTARQTELRARQKQLAEETAAIKAELAKYDAEESANLVSLERDLHTQEAVVAQKEYERLANLVKKRRAEQVQESLRQAQDEAIVAHPALRSYAERNRELTEKTHDLIELTEKADLQKTQAQKMLDDLEKEFERTRGKVDSIGRTGAIGIMLRKQRAALPGISTRRQNIRNRRAILEEAQYALFSYDDERAALADPESVVQSMLAGTQTPVDRLAKERLEQAARELLERRREYLDQLIKNYNNYLEILFELDGTEHLLIKKVETYAQYIDERVLWIRSGKMLLDAFNTDEENFWLVNPERWTQLVSCVWADVQHNAAIYAAALLLFTVLFKLRLRFRDELIAIGRTAEKSTLCTFRPTARAALLTVLISVLWPGLLFFLAWRLRSTSGEVAFVRALAGGVNAAAVFFLPLEILRHVCRLQGLAASHFDWTDLAVRVLRTNLRWLTLVATPLVFVTSTLNEQATEHGRDWPVQVFFIMTMLVLAWFLRRVLQPSSGVFREFIAYHSGGWIDRLKQVWYLAAVLSPLALGVLAFLGYYDTAHELAWRLFATIWFVAALLIARAFLTRWLFLRRRRIAIEQARERRAAAAEKQEEALSATALLPEAVVPKKEVATDLSTHSEQTQKLFNVGLLVCAAAGLWWIWADVLPALHFLDRWPVWTTTVEVTDESPDSPMGQVTRTVVKKVTVAHLILCGFIVLVTSVMARNGPGLMEISLLQRLPLDASVRYAITALTSYAIVLVGLILGFATVGIGWAKVQWLATALTFGLAFGLQEIFANFIAGLILLFDRPIRVGDVVTVDDVSGVVSRIRIRATTITNWDRKEFIIPNKDFITGRLLNWTLSDKINRVVIQVGVAYGSDTELTRALLLKVANEHPLILGDPQPNATFEGFGDSTLNFTLRAYLPNLDNRLSVVHELHTAIDQAFRREGIEIAFPQQDLHIRSLAGSVGNSTQKETTADGTNTACSDPGDSAS